MKYLKVAIVAPLLALFAALVLISVGVLMCGAVVGGLVWRQLTAVSDGLRRLVGAR